MLKGKQMKNIIGIDIGTTHIKSGLFSTDGSLKYLMKDSTETSEDEQGAYYRPEYLEQIIFKQISDIQQNEKQIDGIAVTGMAEAGLALNEKTGQVSQIIPWFDQRTRAMALGMDGSEEYIRYKKTGLRNSFKYGIYKYLWVLQKLQWKMEDTKWLSVCDYVVYLLTGNLVTDPSFAARTYLYNIKDGKWDADLLEKYDLHIRNLPTVIPSGSIAGTLKGTDIPVALCGHDHICAAYGMQLTESGLCNSCGTAETFVGLKNSFEGDQTEFNRGIVYGPYVDGKRFFALTNIPSSGQSIEWIRKQLTNQEISYQKIDEVLRHAGAEPTDILYFPYLSGIGTPYFKSDARAAFLGMNPSHQWKDLLVAAVDGISYQAKWIIGLGYSQFIDHILCVGGATNSPGWMQRKANALGLKVQVPELEEGTLYGAVKLVADRMGDAVSFGENRIRQIYLPDNKATKCFDEIYHHQFLPMAQILCGRR